MSIEEYMSYLLSSPKGSSCVQAGEVLQISHDQVNRFLLQGNYTGKDLYEKACFHLVLIGGTLTVDDSVLDKPYTQVETELITFLYSGKHHRTVKGIGLITLLYTDIKGVSLPVNFRVYDKSSGKTEPDIQLYRFRMITSRKWSKKSYNGDSNRK